MKFKPSFDRYIVLDGSTGINLQKAGMPSGVCPEKWILDNPSALLALQRRFITAGSEALYAPTFGANRVKLKKYGLEKSLQEMNIELVKLTREAVGDSASVGGDMSSLGVFLRPFGDFTFDMLLDIYAEQAEALEKAGVDFFIAETLMTLAEARAALLAVRSVSKKPFVCSFTFEKNGRTLNGTEPLAALAVMQSMGADAFGINCSTGPEDMLKLTRPLAAHTRVPLLSKPNAGIPETDSHGNARYTMTDACFAAHTEGFARAGVRLFGGCCGTEEKHIARLKEELQKLPNEILSIEYPREEKILAANEKKAFIYDTLPETGEVFEIGESFADDITDAEPDEKRIPVIKIGSEQDVEIFAENQYLLQTPVAFAAENDALLEKTLKIYNGRAFAVGNGAEKTARKYGAPVIGQ